MIVNRLKVAICIVIGIFGLNTADAALSVKLDQPKATGQKTVVKLTLKNSFTENIEGARATLFLIGDQDMVLPPDRLDDVRRRFEQWNVDAMVNVYPGGTHAFNTHGSSLYHQESDERSWDDATEWITARLQPGT